MTDKIGSVEIEIRASRRKLESDLRDAERELKRSIGRMEQAYARGGDDASRSWRRGQRRMVDDTRRAAADIQNSSQQIGRALAVAAGALVGGVGVRAVTEIADSYTRFTNALKIAGVEGVAFAEVQDRLFAAANRNGVSAETLGVLYGRLAQAQRDLGASQSDLLRFTDGVSAAIRVQGASAAESRGALIQLTQALGGEIVRAEEFNSINEGARPILVAVAQGADRYRGSVAALRREVIEGKVSSREFFQAFLRGSASLESQAARAPLTTAAAIQVLRNQLTRYVGEADAGVGASVALGQAIKLLAENLDLIVPALAALSVGLGVGFVTNASRAALAANGAAGSFRAMGAAMLTAFGGPVGLAITAVSIALGAFAIDAAAGSKAAHDAERTLEDLAARAEQLAGAVGGLSNDLVSQAAAARQSAADTDTATGAYDRARVAAMNAAAAIQYMTAAQRQGLLVDLQRQKRGLVAAMSGGVFDPVTVDQRERVNNSRVGAGRALGVSPGALPSAQDIDTTGGQAAIARARDILEDGTLGPTEAANLQDYLNAVAVLRDQMSTLSALDATIGAVTGAIDDPTLPEPVLSGGGGAPGDTASDAERRRVEQRAQRRQDLALEREIATARASGDRAAIEAAEERQQLVQLTRQYEAAGYADAEFQAKQHLALLNSQEQHEERIAALAEQAAKRKASALDLQTRTTAAAESELRRRLELAELAGDDDAIRAAERELFINERINELLSLRPELNNAARRDLAAGDWTERENARMRGEQRDMFASAFSEGLRAALSGDLRGFLSNQFGTLADEMFTRAGEHLYDAIFGGFDAAAQGAAEGAAHAATVGPVIVTAGATAAASMATAITSAGAAAGAAMAAAMRSASPGGLPGGTGGFDMSGGGWIGTLRDLIPGFASGTSSAPGGLAYVHGGEVLANLSPGTSVIPAHAVRAMGSMGAGRAPTVDVRLSMDGDWNIKAKVDDRVVAIAGPLVTAGHASAVATAEARIAHGMAQSQKYGWR